MTQYDPRRHGYRPPLDGIVKNGYATDPGKLAAWISASDVEKAPKKTAQPTP